MWHVLGKLGVWIILPGCAVLLAASVVGALYSRFRSTELHIPISQALVVLRADGGVAELLVEEIPGPTPALWRWSSKPRPFGELSKLSHGDERSVQTHWRLRLSEEMGLSCYTRALDRQRQPLWAMEITVPLHWLATLPALVLLGWWYGRNTFGIQAIRRRRGLCVACGYDLRATPYRCPECGHTVSLAERKMIIRRRVAEDAGVQQTRDGNPTGQRRG
jgi:predicted RNA-binding Zn-ribbon protein involved in translation (DUF1610 family)